MSKSDLDWMVRSVHARGEFLEECYRRVKNAANDVIAAHTYGADLAPKIRAQREAIAWHEHIRAMAEGNRNVTRRLDELIMLHEPAVDEAKGRG